MLVDFILNEVLPWPDEDNKRYDLKILDPACGSGIFLVESYKRLIARWKYCNPSVKVTKNILEKLLLNSIYGIEINPDAIKVAAFSLYLTMLNYTDPKEVLSDVKFFKPLIRWSNEQEIAEHKGKDTGNNLFQYNTFDPEIDVYNNTFDLVVGNPPWKRNQLDELVGKYLNDHKFPDQIMCAYLDKMSRIIPSGEIALVSTAKLLFNTGKIYESFRQRFFNNNNIEAIINFSILRDVIFEKAKTPAAVIIYLPFKQESEYEHNSRIIYCTPKNTETIKNRKSIVIDASEIKYISRSEIVKKGSNVFKIAMWGNVRDQKLINKLKEYPSLNSMISKQESGMGLINDKDASKKGNARLSRHLFIKAESIQPYYTEKKGLSKFGDMHEMYRKDDRNIFDPPLILFKEGTKNDSVCSAFIDYKCAYLSAVLGIKLKNKNAAFHKALVACYNSAIGNYYFFLTGFSWETNKGGQIQRNEAKNFPAFPYSLDMGVINELANKVDAIIKIKKENGNDEPDESVVLIQKQIDEILYRELNITSNERSTIEDVLKYSIALKNRYLNSKAEKYIENLNAIQMHSLKR